MKKKLGSKRYYVSGIVVDETSENRTPGVFHDVYAAEDEDDALEAGLEALSNDLTRAGVARVSILAHDALEVPEDLDGEMVYGVSLLVARDLDLERGSCSGLSLACGFVMECDGEEEAVEMSKTFLLRRDGASMTEDNVVIHSGHALALMPRGVVLQ